MADCRRSGEGRKVIAITARWVVQEAAFRGFTARDCIEGRCSFTDMGITGGNAAATLKHQISAARLQP